MITLRQRGNDRALGRSGSGSGQERQRRVLLVARPNHVARRRK